MYLKIGHRGAMDHEPENTLASFRKAIGLGADMIELDVHRTKDGVLVVFHDDTVYVPSVGEHVPIDKLFFRSIQKLRRGKRRIPTLSEVISIARNRCDLYIEIKADDIERDLAALVGNRATRRHVIIASFNPSHIRRIKDIDPLLRTSLLVRRRDQEIISGTIASGALESSAIRTMERSFLNLGNIIFQMIC